MDAIFKKLYGKPALGKSGSIAFDGTDKTANLDGGCLYQLVATQDCFIAVGGLATTAANQCFVPMGVPVVFSMGPHNTVPVLHVTQVTASGTLYYTKLDSVG